MAKKTKKTKTTPPSPPRSERSAFRAMLEAELIGRKEARRAAPDYNPAMILMSPFEDARLVLAQYRREHPELGDYELIEYAIVEPPSRTLHAGVEGRSPRSASLGIGVAARDFDF